MSKNGVPLIPPKPIFHLNIFEINNQNTNQNIP